jgi:hypothetical protein
MNISSFIIFYELEEYLTLFQKSVNLTSRRELGVPPVEVASASTERKTRKTLQLMRSRAAVRAPVVGSQSVQHPHPVTNDRRATRVKLW